MDCIEWWTRSVPGAQRISSPPCWRTVTARKLASASRPSVLLSSRTRPSPPTTSTASPDSVNVPHAPSSRYRCCETSLCLLCLQKLLNLNVIFFNEQQCRRRRDTQTTTIKDGLSDTTLITSGPIKTRAETRMFMSPLSHYTCEVISIHIIITG